jgi:ATP-binding cassette, subfamily B, bacterial
MTDQKQEASQKELWRERLKALKNLPGVTRLIWESSPYFVTCILVLRVFIALVPLGILAVSRRIIDIVNFKATGAAHNPAHLWPLLWMEFALAAGGVILGRALDYYDARLADIFTNNVSLKVIEKASSLDLASFEDPAFYDRLERARVQATDRVVILTSAGNLFQRTISLVSLAGAVIWYSPLLFLFLFVCVLPAFIGETQFALVGYSLAHRLTPIRRELDYLRTLGSSRDSAKEIKMFALADYLLNRYRTLSAEVIRSNKEVTQKRLLWAVLFAALGACGYYGGYAYLVFQALEGHITIGTLALLTGAIAGANSELQTVFSLFSNISEQSLFLTDLLVFLREIPRIVSKPGAIPIPRPIRGEIEFRDVSFHYPGSDKLILQHLNLKISKGERVALVGENGQGKTTLVKLATRLYDPSEGAVLIDGVDLREYKVEELRSEIGVLFQDFFRYDMSVRDNIGVGRVELLQDDAALWDAARRSQTDEIVGKLPGGLEQMLGTRFEGSVDLSGGQWQRLGLARAYLRNAQILILDEPTASLDAVAESEVFAAFSELTEDRIALLISHRFSTVRMAGRIVVLSEGRIGEEGTHDELVAQGGIYEKLFALQAENYR